MGFYPPTEGGILVNWLKSSFKMVKRVKSPIESGKDFSRFSDKCRSVNAAHLPNSSGNARSRFLLMSRKKSFLKLEISLMKIITHYKTKEIKASNLVFAYFRNVFEFIVIYAKLLQTKQTPNNIRLVNFNKISLKKSMSFYFQKL